MEWAVGTVLDRGGLVSNKHTHAYVERTRLQCIYQNRFSDVRFVHRGHLLNTARWCCVSMFIAMTLSSDYGSSYEICSFSAFLRMLNVISSVRMFFVFWNNLIGTLFPVTVLRFISQRKPSLCFRSWATTLTGKWLVHSIFQFIDVGKKM